MMYDGIVTKPPLDELYHEKAHKYIERYKNSKGNWVYKYVSSVSEYKKKKRKEDPLWGSNPRERKMFELTKKTTKKTADAIIKTKKSIKKQKQNLKYGKNTLIKSGRG